jgi:hypothetical protein
LALAVTLGVTAYGKVPRLLIAQFSEDPAVVLKYESLVLDSYLAASLDEIGQVRPLVWSMADSEFRQIAANKSFPVMWESPNQASIVDVARAVEADYTIVVWSMKQGIKVRPVATLYRGAAFRKVWTFGNWDKRLQPIYGSFALEESEKEELMPTLVDPKFTGAVEEFTAVITSSGADWVATSETIARTWAFQLKQGPFAGLAASPKASLDDPTPGLGVATGTGVALSGEADLARIDSLVAKGESEMALVQLRDMVDREPMNEMFRWRLCELLEKGGFSIEAAREAGRGAVVAKDPQRFYIASARNWIRADHPDLGREALNHALARGASGREVFKLMGQLSLRLNDPGEAIDWYTKSMATGPTPDIVFERALSFALAGMDEACRSDLASLSDVPSEKLKLSYEFASELTEAAMRALSIRLRDRLPSIRVKGLDPQLIAEAAKDEQLAKALSGFMDLTPCPSIYASSHQLRMLAHKLIWQSSTEVLQFAKTRNEELGTEATMSLRAAFEVFPRMEARFREERALVR